MRETDSLLPWCDAALQALEPVDETSPKTAWERCCARDRSSARGRLRALRTLLPAVARDRGACITAATLAVEAAHSLNLHQPYPPSPLANLSNALTAMAESPADGAAHRIPPTSTAAGTPGACENHAPPHMVRTSSCPVPST